MSFEESTHYRIIKCDECSFEQEVECKVEEMHDNGEIEYHLYADDECENCEEEMHRHIENLSRNF